MNVDERGCYADATRGYYARMLRAEVEVEVERQGLTLCLLACLLACSLGCVMLRGCYVDEHGRG